MHIKQHCFFGFLIRLLFSVIGAVQDAESELQYTDVDYKVFTDASRHVLKGESPFLRHTYRYSPLFSYLLLPNVFIHPIFGKLLFSIIDCFIGVIIFQILRLDGLSKNSSRKYSLCWLYNPLSVAISTRGNADSVSALIVLSTILSFKQQNYYLAGCLHGLAVHLRLYPVIYCLPLYICTNDASVPLSIESLYPNKQRINLIFSFLLSFLTLTYLFYVLYGYEFLYESLIYHMKRTDIRHNYSVFFYFQYLNFGTVSSSLYKGLSSVPVIALMIVLPLVYNSSKDLPFCQMCMTFVLVMYNSVVTCQYFVWYLCLLPICLPYMNKKKVDVLLIGTMWCLSLLTWLLPAYLLEYRGLNTFFYIWIQGLVFFFSNVMVLTTAMKAYCSKKIKYH